MPLMSLGGGGGGLGEAWGGGGGGYVTLYINFVISVVKN